VRIADDICPSAGPQNAIRTRLETCASLPLAVSANRRLLAKNGTGSQRIQQIGQVEHVGLCFGRSSDWSAIANNITRSALPAGGMRRFADISLEGETVKRIDGETCAQSMRMLSDAVDFRFVAGHRNRSFPVAIAALVLCSFMVPVAHAQVALDASTSSSGDLTSDANTLTFAHTSTGTNLVLVVGVSLNISGRAGTAVSGVTYNGTALQSAGNQLNGNRRTEIWYLVAPATEITR